MKVAGCVMRIVVYTVVIIMGILALVVPPALEDYWFEAEMQQNLERIAAALDNPFCIQALLPIGIIGVLFNSAALGIGVASFRKRKGRNAAAQLPGVLAGYSAENVMDFLVYIARVVIGLIFVGFAGCGLFAPYSVINKFVVAISVLFTVGNAAALGFCVVGKRKTGVEETAGSAESGGTAASQVRFVAPGAQPPVTPAAPARPVPPAQPVQDTNFAPSARQTQQAPQATDSHVQQPVSPVQPPVAPIYPAQPMYGGRDAYGGWYDDFGGYHDAYGGYYDAYGGYHSADGSYYPPMQ